MEQHSMQFGPAARRTDPATSREAAETITKSGTRGRQTDLVQRLVEKFPGCTCNELAGHAARIRMRLTERQLSRRLSDAHSQELVTPGDPRKCQVTGANARVWFSTKVPA